MFSFPNWVKKNLFSIVLFKLVKDYLELLENIFLKCCPGCGPWAVLPRGQGLDHLLLCSVCWPVGGQRMWSQRSHSNWVSSQERPTQETWGHKKSRMGELMFLIIQILKGMDCFRNSGITGFYSLKVVWGVFFTSGFCTYFSTAPCTVQV